jgi:hypothetical protein
MDQEVWLALTLDAKSITFRADSITFGKEQGTRVGFVNSPVPGGRLAGMGAGALAAAGWRPRHVGG